MDVIVGIVAVIVVVSIAVRAVAVALIVVPAVCGDFAHLVSL